jgi:hypothetical protein
MFSSLRVPPGSFLTARLTTFTGILPKHPATSPGARPAAPPSPARCTRGVRGEYDVVAPRGGCGSGRLGVDGVERAAGDLLASSARTRASVSTTGPREQLMRTAVGFIFPKASSPIIFRVWRQGRMQRHEVGPAQQRIEIIGFAGAVCCPLHEGIQ